jgi:hypothetical protein
MPSTWAATANTQLITRSALQDGVTNGYLTLKSGQSITGTTQICTKSYIESVINGIDTTRSDWSGLSSTQCPTKSKLQNSTIRSIRPYLQVDTGYSATFTVQLKRYNSSTITTVSSALKAARSCTLDSSITDLYVGDTVYFNWSTALYSVVEGKFNKNTTDCVAGSFLCGANFVVGASELITVNFGFSLRTPISPCL